MSEYWAGLLTIPAVLLGLCLLAVAVFGTWQLVEAWAKGRWTRFGKVTLPEVHGSPGCFQFRTKADLGRREVAAALTLTSAVTTMFRVSPGIGIILVRSKPKDQVKNTDVALLSQAVVDAVETITHRKEEEQNA